MFLSKPILDKNVLHAHNDTYVLDSISAVSTRRPFLSAGLMIAALITGFSVAFLDILYVGELAALAIVSLLSGVGGLTIGQLHLTSRDLQGSPIADSIYGIYSHLNRLRPQIAEAVERAKNGGAS